MIEVKMFAVFNIKRNLLINKVTDRDSISIKTVGNKIYSYI